MTNGIVFEADAIRFKCTSAEVANSNSGLPSWLTASNTHSGKLEAFYTPDAIQWLVGTSITCGSGPGTWVATYRGPSEPSGGYTVSGATFRTSVEMVVRLVGVTVYATLYSKFRTVVDSIEIYVNGSLSTTLAGFDVTTDALGPTYWSYFGGFVKLTPSCTAGGSGTPSYPFANFDYTVSTDSSVSGGVCWEIGGADVEAPVAWPDYTLPSVPSCSVPVTMGTVTGSTSYQVTATARALVRRIGKWCKVGTSESLLYPYIVQESRGSWAWIIPNWDRTYERFDTTGFAELPARGGLPATTIRQTRSCWESATPNMPVPPPTNYTVTVDTEVHPPHTTMLSTVGPTTHLIEDPLAETVYSGMYLAGGIEQHAEPIEDWPYDPGLGDCPPSTGFPNAYGTGSSVEFPYSVETSTQNTYLLPYLDHAVDKARYINYWMHPHWHFYPWFPPDGLTDVPGWFIDGSVVDSSSYFLPNRTQHCKHPSLPSGENHQTRLSLPVDCLWESGHGPFIKAFLTGLESSWWGISRWITNTADIPASVAYDDDSAALWELTDCTAVFGALIVLTPSASTIKARLTLGSWTVRPWMYCHFADRLKPDWETANISAVRAYLCSQDGLTRVLLEQTDGDGYTTRNVVYARPDVADARHAGSWPLDRGCSVVTDAGADSDATNGISAATMADAERQMAFQLLAGFGAAHLEFEIDVVSMSTDVTLKYPTFYAPSALPALLWEDGHYQDVLYENGAGLRMWGLEWASGNTPLQPPVLLPFPFKATVLHWLCIRRALFEAKDPWDGTITEIGQHYNSYEGQSVSNANAKCIAALLPIGEGGALRAALVNTYSEIPPMAWFPRRKRDRTTWEETGDYAMECWVWAQEPKYFVSAEEPAHLFVGGEQWTTDSGLSLPAPWTASSHSHATDGSESDARLKVGGKEIAKSLRPWWGLFFVYALKVLGRVANLHTSFGQFVRAVASATGVEVKGAEFGAPDGGWLTLSHPVEDPSTYVHMTELLSDDGVILMASDGTTLKRFVSFNAGADWMEATPMTGVKFEKGATSHSEVVTILGYVEASAKLKGSIMKPDETSFGTPFSVTDAGYVDIEIAAEDFDISYTRDGDDALILTCTIAGETDPSEWRSFDYGRTFERVA